VVEAIIALNRNVAHRLIEEFMLLANETVATHLEVQQRRRSIVSMRNRHPQNPKFEEFVSGFGYSLGAPVNVLRPRHSEAAREDSRQAGGKADRDVDAANDAEGALRAGKPGPLRPGVA
jgi:ribonuclease R